jgi:IclR family acetate operon transcriptional repressor
MARRALAGQKNDTLGGATRALRVLDVFARSVGDRSLAPREIAEALTMNLSTCYHVLNTLAAEGYVVRDQRTGLLSLGAKIAALSRAYDHQVGFTPEISLILSDLARDTGENVALAILQRDVLVIVDVIESVERVRVAGLSPGVAEHLHARGLGKAVLAHKDRAFVERHFDRQPPVALTANTHTAMSEIWDELDKTRTLGYSEDNQEFALGVCGIGAAFFHPTGEVAGSLVVSIPTLRVEEKRTRLIALATAASRGITTALRAAD